MEENEKKSGFQETLDKVEDQFKNAPDSTAEYDQADINSNKVMAILAYFGILFLIPLLAAKNSKFARFHTNQGIVLFIVAILVSIVSSILSRIHLGFIGWILDVVVFIFALIGIINAAQGKAKELPYIGKYKILK
ncbi:MAG: zinc ribbon domain-containing protein [Bacteroidales bacterium]|nr:zinc ribbon domain-containing protein [Bacteroidales bacterium]MBQ2105004.1 zinc ribbon domain-containing protein [Bacteroidales bacterium]MBQ2501009.1 zinc ribbon domain-containing protein [Bacteroidales bacterium]MBQ5416903.1 zinc ribbon domain-containing protein [Bacteroidales bacterium]MBQ7072595.1 zinc ribbon domain-containing protein [Bacteroidales bacterium]